MNMTTKLDQNTLAALFQQHTQTRKSGQPVNLNTLFDASEASDKRIALAEKLAEDRLSCESLRLANALKPWAKSIGRGLAAQQSAATPWWRQAWQPARWLVAGCAFAALALVVAPQWHQSQSPPANHTDAFFAGHFDPASQTQDRIFSDQFKTRKPTADKPLFKARFEDKNTGQA